MRNRSRGQTGFTLIELLVVLTIIMVLISIILPALGRVRNIAMAVKCQSNVHTLMTGFIAFAADHDGCLPGADRTPSPAPYQLNWLMTTYGTAPYTGTVYPYINSATAFICPAVDVEKGNGTGNYEYASNGKFDYGFFTIFNGSPIRIIPLTSQMKLLNGGLGTYPTPIICQEDGYQVNGYNVEGNHSNVDQMSHIHAGGSYYSGIDGSVNFVIEPDVTGSGVDGCHQWTCKGPTSKNMVDLGTGYGAWGSWGAM